MNQFPSKEEIAVCAFLLWEHEGRPNGRDKVHWHQAETQLIVCHAHDQWMSEHFPQPFKRLQEF